jgi:hypothetical protein
MVLVINLTVTERPESETGLYQTVSLKGDMLWELLQRVTEIVFTIAQPRLQ